MTILGVYESRMTFWRRHVEVLQNFGWARFGSGIQVEVALVASSRPGTAKARGARTDRFFVRGPKGELVLFTEHESERRRACAACRAKGYRRQLEKPLDSAARLLTFPKCSEGPRSVHRLVHVNRLRGRRRSSITVKHQQDAFLQRGPDVRDECRDDARLPTGMSPLMEPDMSGDRDGKVPADRRTSLLPEIWHRGLEDTISLHRYKEEFRQQRHRSRVALRTPRGFETCCPGKNTGHNLKSYT